MTAQKQQFRPQLSSLEDRRCPAVSVTVVDGHILQVNGDRGNNAVIIAQDGDQVTVTGDGSAPATFAGIDTVRVNTWAGDDNVTIRSHDTYKRLPEFTFDIDLGAGNDSMAVFCPTDQFIPPSDSSVIPMKEFDVEGGGGDDTVRSFIGDPDAPMAPPTGYIREGVCLDYDGDAGDDTFITEVRNVVMDAFNEIKIGGGRGNDMLKQRVDNVVITSAFSWGLAGGAGDDVVDLSAHWGVGAGGTTAVNLQGDGGSDRIGAHIHNYIATGAESDYKLDGGEGADSLSFSYEESDGGAVMGTLDLSMTGRQGNDLLSEILLPSVQRGGSFKARVDGGAGNDMNTAIIMPTVDDGGAFSALIDGGDGSDVLTGFVEDPNELPGGMVDVAFLGGRGDDFIDVQVDLAGFTPESGELHVAINAGHGSDHSIFFIKHGGDKRMENTQFTLDAGAGEDFAIVSPLVDVTNVEHSVIM